MAACNTKYSAVEIYNAITFKVTDATAHNFDVDEMVAMDLGKDLKKERFIRFVYFAAVVLHHQKQVQAFLQKYDTINTLACIVRAFEECEFLSVLLITTAIIGVHLIEPYLSVTYFDPVNYEQLIPIMRQLYEDLKTTVVVELLDITRSAFKFIDADEVGWKYIRDPFREY